MHTHTHSNHCMPTELRPPSSDIRPGKTKLIGGLISGLGITCRHSNYMYHRYYIANGLGLDTRSFPCALRRKWQNCIVVCSKHDDCGCMSVERNNCFSRLQVFRLLFSRLYCHCQVCVDFQMCCSCYYAGLWSSDCSLAANRHF